MDSTVSCFVFFWKLQSWSAVIGDEEGTNKRYMYILINSIQLKIITGRRFLIFLFQTYTGNMHSEKIFTFKLHTRNKIRERLVINKIRHHNHILTKWNWPSKMCFHLYDAKSVSVRTKTNFIDLKSYHC